MPKYLNSTSAVITMGAVRVEPGETVSTLQFIPGALPAGITEVTSAPTITPIVSSAKLTSGATVTIPETVADPISGVAQNLVGNYLITIAVAVGDATVQLNGVGVARYVGLYETYTIRCLSRIVDTLVIVTSGTVYVTVELI